MKITFPFLSRIAPFLIILLFIGCNNEPSPVELLDTTTDQLGSVNIEVSGDEKAREEFIKGLLLLHSFEYADSRAAFKRAREIDPDMVMAYWGEAMTYNHPLWRSQNKEKAMEILEMLGETEEERIAKTQTDLEKDFIRSLEILYGEGEKNERDAAHSEFLATMHKKYPDNQEVTAFYALSILGAVPVGRNDEAYEKAANVAMSILKENPEHPGALHYSIHSYDDPYHAHLAKKVADRYSEVAPDAAHALHMPSHIYVALGLWQEVVRSNIASWNASVSRMKRKELDQDAVSYHALHWLLYGYLQQGNRPMADSIMRSMQRYVSISPSISARSYLIEMTGNYLAETGDWTHPFADVEVDLDSLNIVNQAEYYFIKGMRDREKGLSDFLFMTTDKLRRERERAELFVSDEGLPLCSSASLSIFPNSLDVQQSKVMELLLTAEYADLLGDDKKAERLFREAVELEAGLSYSYGPPVIPYPPNQKYGDWLAKRGRHAEALDQYEKALVRGPGRTRVLQAALASAKALGLDEKVTQFQEELSSPGKSDSNDHGDPVLHWASR